MAVGSTASPVRQAMINMMYLVLMALLALNVSADILKAFALVNGALGKTNEDYNAKNALTMTQFQKLLKVNKGAAEKYYNAAQKAHVISDQMFLYIQSIKNVIAKKSDG